MKKRTLQFEKSLKTILFLAVLSICSINVWAQVGIKSDAESDESYKKFYHRFNFGNGDGPYTLEFSDYNNQANKLYENAFDEYGYNNNDSLGNKLSFLGQNNIYINPFMNAAFYIDTAYVNRGTGLIKPQYMLAVNPYIADECSDLNAECTNGKYVIARYLYNAAMYAYIGGFISKYFDKTKGEGIPISETETESGYYYRRNNFNVMCPVGEVVYNADYVIPPSHGRLAFSWAIHKGDSLYVLKGIGLNPAYKGTENASYLLWMTLTKEYGVEGKSIDFSKLISENIIPESTYKAVYFTSDTTLYPEMRTYYDYKPAAALSPGKTIGLQAIIALDDNTHKDWVFSFLDAGRGATDVYIESETFGRDFRQSMITPEIGGWLSIHNGVPIMNRPGPSGSYGSIYTYSQTDASPVHNETPEVNTATKATVIGGTGCVTVQNAISKFITISNLFGQTITQIKAASDNITISAPAGVLVVSVEGEKAIKVVVK